MGVYSVSTYGVGTYGPVPPSQFATDVTVRPIEYDQLLLSWGPPPGTWSEMRLVRSSYGFPMTITDGHLLLTVASGAAPTSLLDDGLRPGRFYYYTLFVFATSDSVWVPAGAAMGLVPVAHAYQDTLWGLLPNFYRTADEAYRGAYATGPLNRFMGLLGYQVDRVRTEIDTLLKIADIDLVSGTLLPTLAASLGTAYEPELGMRASRSLVKNQVHLAKTKGTKPGVEGVASAYSAFGATAVIGKNLLLDENAAGWTEGTASTWTATGATLGAYLPSGYTAAVAGTGTLRLIAAGGGDAVAISGTYGGVTLIPVTAGSTYVASVYVRHAGTARTATLRLVYYSVTGAVLGTFTGAAAANTAAWVRREIAGAAPANAVWAAMTVTVAGAAAAEEHLLSAAQFEEAAVATTWESARRVHVYLEPQRSNLVPNPSFEVNTTGWTGTATTLARVTTQFVSGAAAMSLTKITAAGTATTTTPTGTSGIAVTGGETYTVSASLKPNTTARNVTLAIGWYTAAGALISTSTSTAAAETAAAWKRFTHTAQAPVTAAFAAVVVNVASAAINEVHWLDAVLFENTEFVKDYFDASLYPPSDYLWSGTAHNSASHVYPRRTTKNERLVAVLADAVPAGTSITTHYGETVPASSI